MSQYTRDIWKKRLLIKWGLQTCLSKISFKYSSTYIIYIGQKKISDESGTRNKGFGSATEKLAKGKLNKEHLRLPASIPLFYNMESPYYKYWEYTNTVL